MSLYAVMNAVSSPEESASRRSEILTALHHNDGLPDCGKVDSRSVDRLVYSIASTTMKDPTKSESIPIAEEQLRKVTIGEPNVVNSTIAIVDYDPVWPVLFEEEARRIRAALGERVLRVEHVGSTSVCRLAAKPIIDIVLVVADAADEAAYAPALEAAGYILRIREPDWYQHRMFRGPDRDINLHCFSDGCPEIERMLVFRDWLRANDVDRLLYKRTKRELAAKTWKYVQNYADAKTAVVEEILARAQNASGSKVRDVAT